MNESRMSVLPVLRVPSIVVRIASGAKRLIFHGILFIKTVKKNSYCVPPATIPSLFLKICRFMQVIYTRKVISRNLNRLCLD